MDSIRLSQINEALNYDKNINGMVWNLEKKRTAAFPDPEVLPYSQLGEETMTTTKEGSNSLKVLLEAKIASVVQFINSQDQSSAADIGQVQPLVQAYNQVVAPYASTQLTQQTREAILTEVRYLLSKLGDLTKALRRAIQTVAHNPFLDFAVRYCVICLAVAEIMGGQIKTAKLLPISDEDIEDKVNNLLDKNASWKAAVQRNPRPGGGPGGGPPPPPPPPPGGFRGFRPGGPREGPAPPPPPPTDPSGPSPPGGWPPSSPEASSGGLPTGRDRKSTRLNSSHT